MNKNRISCCALALSCLLASCQDEMKDEEMPTVSITSPQADTKLWSEVTASAEVIDNQEVSKVAFYLDDELLGEDAEAPYELSFDSKQYEDGPHRLKTVAYDGSNNQSEATRNIEIFNKLLKVTTGAGYLSDSDPMTRTWMVVSDISGRILQTEELQNSNNFTFNRPDDFEDTLLSVTIITIDNDSYGSAKANTYFGIRPSEWRLDGKFNSENPTALGEVTGSFTSPQYNFYNHALNGQVNANANFDDFSDKQWQIDFSTIIYQDPAHMYIALFPENEPASYKLIDPIQPGEHYELATTDFTPMEIMKTVSLPPVEWASLRISGYYGSEEKESYGVSSSGLNQDKTSITAYFPKDIFSSFEYTISARRGNVWYYGSHKGELPGNYEIPETIQLTVVNADRNNFEATVSHPRSYSIVNWGGYNSSRTFDRMSWVVYGSNDQKLKFVTPRFPEVIAENYRMHPLLVEEMNSLPYASINLVNRGDISSFEEYTAKVFEQANVSDQIETYESITVYPNSENGRTSWETQRPQDKWTPDNK